MVKRRPTRRQESEPPPPPDYSEDGVDLTLIRWMLSLTPSQRLRALDQLNRDIIGMSNGNAATRRLSNSQRAGRQETS